MTNQKPPYVLLSIVASLGAIGCEKKEAGEASSAEPAGASRPVAAEANPGSVAGKNSGSQLLPCHVEFEYTSYNEEKDGYDSTRTPVSKLVRPENFDHERKVDWETAPIAPVPLTRDQLLALPNTTKFSELDVNKEHPENKSVMLKPYGTESPASLWYDFDDAGRASKANFSRDADSSEYSFEYSYECDPMPPAETQPYLAE